MINIAFLKVECSLMQGLIFNIQKFSIHDGAGIRTNVFFQGCNMRCMWCANPESIEIHPARPDSEAKLYTIDELIPELIKDKVFYDASGGGVTLTGGEPLLQAPFAMSLCDALHAEAISVIMETAAHVSTPVFLDVLAKLDAIFIDLKHYGNDEHLRGTGTGSDLPLDNIRAALASNVPTTIRIPIIPGYNNSSDDISCFSDLLKELGAKEVHLLPFHQIGDYKYKKLGLPYAFSGVPGMKSSDLSPFADSLRTAGFMVQIGG